MNEFKAIMTLCNNCRNHPMCGGTGCEPRKTLLNAFKRNQEKSVNYTEDREDGQLMTVYIECPNCEYSFSDDEIDRQISYCPECGQLLRWQDE